MSWFGELVHHVVDYATKGPITRFFTILGSKNNLGFPKKV
jgi:hypothetical protein